VATGASALVAFNDLLAIGALQRLERRGVRVPADLSVVGYDDIFGSGFCNPPLTTVTSPTEDAGRRLVDLLLGRGPVSPPARLVLPVQLHVRESTGPHRSQPGP
jgi:LacI family repressor for deo operon, udp, cdd, tsx, nupC, and nupG